MIKRVALSSIVVALSGFAGVAGCSNEVDDGGDFIEPEDNRDNVDLQGLHDCSQHTDTGYKSGQAFPITVVTVDGRPVEVATANAYIAMQNAASNDGVSLRIVSGFRTMAEQQHLYYCYTSGSCNNGNLAAKPGFSNHQSGHALDLNTSDSGVSSWLKNHASSFGFARTVPSEAWHYEWWGSASDYPGPCAAGGVDNGGGNTNNGGGTDNGGTGGTGGTTTATCAPLDAAGGEIDDGDACFQPGGPSQYLRAMSVGEGGDCLWTGATNNANEVNFANWNLNIGEAGTYTVEVYVDGSVATSTLAGYKVTHQGVTDVVVVDQTGGDRWVQLGNFAFDAGEAQRVHLGDNTGEAASLHKKIAIDAVRLTRVDGSSTTNPTPPPAANDCPYVSIDVTSLNVRPQPNTSHSPVGTLDGGTVVQVLSTVSGESVGGDTDWHRIQTSSLTGYVTGAYTTCQASQ